MPETEQKIAEFKIEIETAEKNLKAFLTITPPSEGEAVEPTFAEVFSLLEEKGLKFGINLGIVKDAIEEKKWGEKILIAEGTPSLPGKDASLEIFFPTDHSQRPQIKEDGHIDYKEVSVVNSVEKDAVLVKKTPVALGPAGTDVFGNALPAIGGKDVPLPKGKGVSPDPSDPNILRAANEGVIFYDPQTNVIEIQQLYLVPENVDYSTGNIHVKSSIEIKGDVKPDFTVTTPYNIQVRGVIENAAISCEGSLTARVGIKGDNKRIINVGGDIHAGYINNQIIKCGGSVYASTEIRNSNIECAEEVILVKNSGIIIGGKVTASKKVNCAVIGNLYGTPTEIEVGVDLNYAEKYHEKENALKAAHKMICDLESKIRMLEDVPPGAGKPTSVSGLKNQKAEYVEEVERLGRELKEIGKSYFNVEDPMVSITKVVYPGTTIKIKHARFVVNEELERGIFKLHGNDITFTKR